MLKGGGISQLRYSIPWHQIERVQGTFDFDWIDGPLSYMREHGMTPVVDLVHHTSFPDWLEEGFANAGFPQLFVRFVGEFASRYPWIYRYTVFNEPLATTLMCSSIGSWYPYRSSDRDFAAMAVNVARAICMADQFLSRSNPAYESVYIDTCEHHQALDEASRPWVEFANHRRWLLLDLTMGNVDEGHPLFSFVTDNGVAAEDLAWLKEHRAVPHLLGLDYYPHSEIEWAWSEKLRRADIVWPPENPRGFRVVAMDYVARYGLPVMLTETNIRGTIFDRITWLRFMEEQCEHLLTAGVDLRGFCWYPSIDSTDWAHLCAKHTGDVDPQGIWCLDPDDGRWHRHDSELSEWYSRLAKGQASWRDLPAYSFLPPLDRDLAGYTKLMSHWEEWRDAPDAELAA